MATPTPDESSSDVLLGQLLQHYVEDMTNFQAEVISEDEYFNREEQCVDRLECIKQTIEGDTEEIKICVNRAHTLIEFLHTSEEFPEKYQIGMITAGILSTQTMLRTIASNEAHLEFFMTFLDRREDQWDEVQASQWARVATSLVASHLPRTFFADKDHFYLKKVVHQMASPSIHEFLSFLVGVEPESERASLLPFYVVETDLIQIVVEEMLTKVHDDNFQINSAKTLCTIIGAFSSLPSFSSRFHTRVKPSIESLLEVAMTVDTPKNMTHNVIMVLSELVQYDLRAAKYAALCGRDASNEELPPFFAVALAIMPKIAEYLQTKSLVLWRTLDLVRVLVTSEFEMVLQSLEAHDIMGHTMEAYFADRSSEFARHVVLATVKSVLRGSNYHAKMLIVESSSLLSGIPNAYREVEQTKRQASLGHHAAVLTEVLAAAHKDSDVGCVVDAHGEWGQVRARYPSASVDDNEIGLNVPDMLVLWPGAEAVNIMSPPRAPVRCFASPGVEVNQSITPDASPARSEEDDICMDNNHGISMFGNDDDATILRYEDAEEGEVEDEVMLVAGMESVGMHETVEFNETAADAVHPRTPIGGARPKRNMNLEGLAQVLDMNVDTDDKENAGKTAAGSTPKKMVHSDGGYKSVSGQSDTPKPKVKPQSRTYYSRAAKSKSPFAAGESGGKTKQRVGTPIAGPRTGAGLEKKGLEAPNSAEKMPVKRLF